MRFLFHSPHLATIMHHRSGHRPIAAMARGSHVRGRTRPPILRALRRSIHEGCRCVLSASLTPEEHRRPDGSPAPVPRLRRSSNRGRGSPTSYGSGSTRTRTQQPRCRWSQYGPSLFIVPDGTIAQAAVEMERSVSARSAGSSASPPSMTCSCASPQTASTSRPNTAALLFSHHDLARVSDNSTGDPAKCSTRPPVTTSSLHANEPRVATRRLLERRAERRRIRTARLGSPDATWGSDCASGSRRVRCRRSP